MKVYFLGPEGSYSHQVAKAKYGHEELSPCLDFSEIYHAISSDLTGIGILPIENSITNNVHENVDYLFMRQARIISECFLSIELHLLGHQSAKLENIKTVLSHPKALQQCTQFLNKHQLKAKACASTTAACSEVALKASPEIAALAGTQALQLYSNLKILVENIGNESLNLTRFVQVVNQNSKVEYQESRPKNKYTLIFKTLHKAGALAQLLTALAEEQINLSKIESQPIPGSQFEYCFLVDLEISQNQKIDTSVISKIFSEHTSNFWIIGEYAAGEVVN